LELYSRAYVRRLGAGSEATDIDPFSEDERDEIIDGFLSRRDAYGAFVFFQFWTGARPSEAIALRWGNVDVHRRWARIRASRVLGREGRTKTGKSRSDVLLHESVVEVLRNHMPLHPKHDDFVFKTPTGSPIDQANFYTREWVPMLHRLEIRPRPFYNTRHTYITYMLEIGRSLSGYAVRQGLALR
jgi:integrase